MVNYTMRNVAVTVLVLLVLGCQSKNEKATDKAPETKPDTPEPDHKKDKEVKKIEEKPKAEKLEDVLTKAKFTCLVDMSIRIKGIDADPNWHDMKGKVVFTSVNDNVVKGTYEHAKPLGAKGMFKGVIEGKLKGDVFEGICQADENPLKQKLTWKFTRDKSGKITGATGTFVQPLGFSQKWDLKREEKAKD